MRTFPGNWGIRTHACALHDPQFSRCPSEVLKTLRSQRHAVAIEALGEVSPLSCQHINFYGRYQFEAEGRSLDLAAMASRLNIEAAIFDRRSA